MKYSPIKTISGAVVLLLCSCEQHQAPTAEEPASEPTENTSPPPSLPVPSPKPAKQPEEANVVQLFNGKDLTGWTSVNFGGEGEISIKNGEIHLEMGESLTAVRYDSENELPTSDYEISLEAKKLMGTDFFCGLTFPVRDDHATLVVGGWGGAVVGISSIDDFDASENETAQFMAFDAERWYSIRLRVTKDRLITWIDDKEVINLSIADRRVSMRPGEIELCIPLGIACYQTRSAIRNLRLKKL